MSLQQALRRGDWVRLSSKTGSQIVGQAAHDMATIGPAALTVVVKGDPGENAQTLTVNVNFWDVSVLMGNLLPCPEPEAAR
ncbi:hypothetical protein SEA_KOZIE_68 [Microbacterium phage Kozie]|uniref:Uncharacterized protein n=1 Tax=Microbacterium phage Kozie TaxID=2885981 RepID=A0AAE9C3T9_9CAUD|nr:hypothetical protein QC998_gp68 [Microbacterium phage Kozie]UDL16264.1 hypothetical protein SEA_KOZIE_68 [Microbacterium phage Kozie]